MKTKNKQGLFFGKEKSAQPPAMTFSLGKVASTTIFHSLGKYYPGPAIHTHWLNLTGSYDNEPFGMFGDPCNLFGPNHPDPRFRYIWEWVMEGKDTNIITPIRKPTARNLSSFFHSFSQRIGVGNASPANYSLLRLANLFYLHYPHTQHETWFREHLEALSGIDVYSLEFGTHSQIFHKNNFRLLVIRTETPDPIKSKIIAQFLGVKKFPLTTSNAAANLPYAKIYQEFKRRFKPEPTYVRLMRRSRYYRHFYRNHKQ